MQLKPLAPKARYSWCTVWCWESWTSAKVISQEHAKWLVAI